MSTFVRKALWNIKACAYRHIQFVLSGIEFLDSEKTVKRILESGCSISRYGDGEFGTIFGKSSGFQKPDPLLASRLSEVLNCDRDDVLVCIPRPFRTTKNMNENASDFWNSFFINNGRRIRALLKPGKTYGDSFISRFYMDLKDRSNCADYFKRLKMVWEGRDIIIVEGQMSRLGVGNDIFDNAKSVQRILCPSKDAYGQYEEILNKCKEVIPKDSLVLCALGMTATVLSYDLAVEGYQALDVGHIDIEYEWMRMGATEKCAIPSKAVNGINMPEGDLQDKVYQESIIARIV